MKLKTWKYDVTYLLVLVCCFSGGIYFDLRSSSSRLYWVMVSAYFIASILKRRGLVPVVITLVMSWLGYSIMAFEKTGPASPLMGLMMTVMVALPWLLPWLLEPILLRVVPRFYRPSVVVVYSATWLYFVVDFVLTKDYSIEAFPFVAFLAVQESGLIAIMIMIPVVLVLFAFSKLFPRALV
jgi:hypothetical protein